MISGCNCNACAIRRAPKIHKCLISTCAPQPYGDKSRAKQKQANSSKQDSGILTLMLHTYTGKNRCARAIVPPLAGRPCSDRTSRTVKVRLDLSEPVRSPALGGNAL
jgi:hypothetical protein